MCIRDRNVYGEDGTWGVAPEWTRGDNPVGWTEAYDYQRHGIDILLNGYALSLIHILNKWM